MTSSGLTLSTRANFLSGVVCFTYLVCRSVGVPYPTHLKASEMKIHLIKEMLELYGLQRILEDNLTTLPEILDILIDLGYLDLDMYEREDYPDDI